MTEPDYYTNPVKALESIRKRAKWTNRVCSRRLDCSLSHWMSLKSGRKKPSLPMAFKIERVFYIDVHSWDG